MGYNKEKNTHVACKRGYQKLSLSLHSSDPDKVRECIDTPPTKTCDYSPSSRCHTCHQEVGPAKGMFFLVGGEVSGLT